MKKSVEAALLHDDSAAAAAAKSLQSCPTLCDPIDGSPPGSPVPGILQARTLEWVAISSSNAWKWKMKVKSLSRVSLLVTPWTAAHQAPPSMGCSRQELWSGVPLPSPMMTLAPAYSKCGPYISSTSTTWELARNAVSDSTPDLMNQYQDFNQILWWSVCTNSSLRRTALDPCYPVQVAMSHLSIQLTCD